MQSDKSILRAFFRLIVQTKTFKLVQSFPVSSARPGAVARGQKSPGCTSDAYSRDRSQTQSRGKRSDHAGPALLDELTGGPGAASPGPDGEGLAPGDQQIGGHGDLVLFGQLQQDLAVKGLVRALEGDDQPKPGRQAQQFLAGIRFVQVIAGAVGQGLLDQMPPVGGGIHREVGRTAPPRSPPGSP